MQPPCLGSMYVYVPLGSCRGPGPAYRPVASLAKCTGPASGRFHCGPVPGLPFRLTGAAPCNRPWYRGIASCSQPGVLPHAPGIPQNHARLHQQIPPCLAHSRPADLGVTSSIYACPRAVRRGPAWPLPYLATAYVACGPVRTSQPLISSQRWALSGISVPCFSLAPSALSRRLKHHFLALVRRPGARS